MPNDGRMCSRGAVFDLTTSGPGFVTRYPGSCLPVARTATAVEAHTDVVGPAHAHAHLGHALEAATPARLGVGGPRLLQRQLAQREDAAQRGHLVRTGCGSDAQGCGLPCSQWQPLARLGCSAGLQCRVAAQVGPLPLAAAVAPLRLTVR